MQHIFGSGILWGTPLTDANGVAIANPTPVQFGVLQDVSVEIAAENKMLHGQNQFPIDVARGKGKITCKAKNALVNGALINSIYFGQTVGANHTKDFYDTTGTAIPATPFQITITPPGSGTFAQDLGVRDQTGRQYTRVASGPATGQYSLSGAVYTFASADQGVKVFIDYQYTLTEAIAKQSTVLNLPMGYAPEFRADLSNPYKGKHLTLILFKCIASKLAIATKLDDFAIPEFDFDAFADGSGQVLKWAVSE